MALLYYRNLGVHRPEILMKRAFGELKTFYDFLKRTQDYLESDATVKRLAWHPGQASANGGHGNGRDDNTDSGVWVQLTEEPAPQKSWRRAVGARQLSMRRPGGEDGGSFGIVAASAPATRRLNG